MDSLAKAAGSPMQFQGANGKLYTVAPMRLSEYGQFQNWCRFKPVNDLRSRLAGFPPEVQTALTLKAYDDGKAMTEGQIAEALVSVDGSREAFRICTKRAHGELPAVEIEAAVNEENLTIFVDTCMHYLNETQNPG